MQNTVSATHCGRRCQIPDSGSGSRLGVAVIVLAGAALLAGCGQNREITGSVPLSYRERHPIVVQRAAEMVTLPVGIRGGRLVAADRTLIADFVRGYRSEGDGPLLVLAPSGSANETAAAYTVREVRAVLADLGLAGRVAVRSYAVDDPDAAPPVKIAYERLKAIAGQCGFWPEDLSGDAENRDYWNFGCATQRNLAAQIDNPRDLIAPRRQTPRDSMRRATVFEKYRKGEDSSTQSNDSDKGNISEVAK